MTVAPQIVHESETQRQHVRLPLPALVEIGGQEYEVKDLSSGGVGVRGISGKFQRGQRSPLRLKLPFGTFSFDINLQAETQHYNEGEKTLGLLFVNLTADQISMLNYVLKAFMAGDIVASGDLMNIASRDNFTKARNKGGTNATGPSIRRQLPGLIAITVIGIIIALFILGNLYGSLFVVKANDAVVTGGGVQVNATASGFYHSTLDANATTVQTGQTLGTITPADGGKAVDVKATCACYIAKLYDANNQFVAPGTHLLTLVPVDAKQWVEADIDPAQASKISPDTQADIEVFGAKTPYTGKVAGMELGQADAAGRQVVMKIIPDQKIPVDLAGRPAQVTFSVH